MPRAWRVVKKVLDVASKEKGKKRGRERRERERAGERGETKDER